MRYGNATISKAIYNQRYDTIRSGPSFASAGLLTLIYPRGYHMMICDHTTAQTVG